MEPRAETSAEPRAPRLGAVPGIAGLYLSDAGCATAAALEALGITAVVNATVDAATPACEPALASLRVPVPDAMDAPLHAHLEGAAGFIDGALAAPGGRVCAFCADGASVAPAVVAYYLMRHRRLSLGEALDAVGEAQPAALPNLGFWQRLVEAESWLRPDEPPSLSLQQYRWRHLQRSYPGAERDAILQRLELAQAEVSELLRVRCEWSGV